MEYKTQVQGETGRQDILVSRIFDLPLESLFRAFVEPDLVAQWMGTKVLKLDAIRHGSYRFETTDPKGNVHRFSGCFHECIPNSHIIRTFEMEDTPFPVQLEFLDFNKLTEESSRLDMLILCKSPTDRDNMLKLPFAQGINWAHNRLQSIANKLIT